MIHYKRFWVFATLVLLTSALSAQNTNSVYSRYGLGLFDNPSMGKTNAMGGIGYGYHDHGLLNVLNPASYADVDTMNMLFEFDMSAQLTAFKIGSSSQINPNSYLNNVAMKVALKPNWGLAFGLYSLSKVGYEFHQEVSLSDPILGDLNYIKAFKGSGGLNTVFLGTGFVPLKNLSLGINLNYTFGMLSNSNSTNYVSSSINNESNFQYLYLGLPGVDVGFQYDLALSNKKKLTLGASYSAWKTTSSEFKTSTISTDTVEHSSMYDFNLGNTLGLGLSYQYDKRITVGLDYQQRFLSRALFLGSSDSLKDQTRVALGVEYLPSSNTNNYLQAVRYRMGLQYTDMYFKEPGQLKTASITMGVGLPLRGQKSMLNLGFEMGKLFTPNATFIDESYYKLSVGISFNELWFFKLKL